MEWNVYYKNNVEHGVALWYVSFHVCWNIGI